MSDADHDAIHSVLRDEWMAFFLRDFDGFARHWLHAPFVRRTLSGPRTGTRVFDGWDRISATVAAGMRRYPTAVAPETCLRWDNLLIRPGADMAWVTYDQVAFADRPGLQASGYQHETKVLERHGDAWKLVSLTIVVPNLGRNDTPQVELDSQGRIVSVNAPARRRLDDHPGLVTTGQRLRARNRRHDPAVQEAIGRMLERLSSTNDPRVFSERIAELVPLGEDDYGHPHHCWITIEQERLIVSFDDEALLRQRLDLAAQVFSLSPAQLRLAELITRGAALPDAAEQLGISLNTARTHLRRMQEKAGTSGQTALVSALLSVSQPD